MQGLSEFLELWRSRILEEVRTYLEAQSGPLERVNRWGPDVSRRLLDFSSRGKMIRGALVALGYLLHAEDPPPAVYRAAAAMELLQSAFLVHDDIMDRDLTRRGLPTLFHQYQRLGEEGGVAEARHFGEAMGICAGDASFFFAVDLLSLLDLPQPARARVLRVACETVIQTCVAQMQDVSLGSAGAARPVSETDVLAVYHYKTGRYTFTLPLQIGALIAGRSGAELDSLEAIGERLGMIFQIKDDEMGLYGSEDEIGKPVGSDIGSAKKTLYYVYLMEAVAGEERQRVTALFGRSPVAPESVREVRELVERLGIRSRLRSRLEALAAEARRAIASLPAAREAARGLLMELLDYNLARRR